MTRPAIAAAIALARQRALEDRQCEWCEGSLAGHRKDALACNPSCRSDARHWRGRSEAFWGGIRAIRHRGPTGRAEAARSVQGEPTGH